MLKTEISSKIPLVLGLSAPPVKDQVESQGLTLPSHELWERRHTALNLLNLGGFLTTIECERIAQRLMTGICQDAYFEELVREVEAEADNAPVAPASPGPREALNIIFDGPPGPEGGRFVEVETDDGRSTSAGEWLQRPDGLHALRIVLPFTPPAPHQEPSAGELDAYLADEGRLSRQGQ